MDRARFVLLIQANLFVLVIAVPSLFGLLAGRSTVGELATHCTFNFFLLSAVALIIGLVLRSWKTIAVPIALVALHGFAISPFYLVRPMQPSSSQPNLRIVTANVMSGHSHSNDVLDFLRSTNADVVCIQELTPALQRAVLPIADLYPYRIEEAREGVFGIGLYSKRPLANARIMDMAGDDTPSAVAEVHVNGQDVTIVACHTRPPITGELFNTRNAELDALAEFCGGRKDPIIVAGDLNTTMWSPFYKDLRKTSGLRNVRRGFGVKATWPAVLPLFKIPIDHVLVSPETMVVDVELGPNIGSDHLPLIVDLFVSAPGKYGV